jgi:hypothetical protein
MLALARRFHFGSVAGSEPGTLRAILTLD